MKRGVIGGASLRTDTGPAVGSHSSDCLDEDGDTPAARGDAWCARREAGRHRACRGAQEVRVVLGNKALWMSGAARTACRHGEGAPKQTGDIARNL
jgi:hypothetical protein